MSQSISNDSDWVLDPEVIDNLLNELRRHQSTMSDPQEQHEFDPADYIDDDNDGEREESPVPAMITIPEVTGTYMLYGIQVDANVEGRIGYPTSYVWMARNGTPMPIWSMSTFHIVHAIRHMWNRINGAYPHMLSELNRRNDARAHGYNIEPEASIPDPSPGTLEGTTAGTIRLGEGNDGEHA